MLQKFLKLAGISLTLLTIIGIGGSLHAQTSLGQIAGNVTDTTGGVIPETTITITNLGPQAVRTLATDSNGFYVATNLPIGDYSVEIMRSGFRGEKRSGLSI